MKTLIREKAFEGDWVSGRSENDEKFHGFIEAINFSNRTVKVRVTQSDNEASIGKNIETPIRLVEVLPLEKFNEEGQILNLIDFALLIKDEAWFMELTAELKVIQELNKLKNLRKTTALR